MENSSLKIVEYPWGVLCGESEHFAFMIYNSVDKRKYNVVLQATLKYKSKNGKKFEISSCLFDSRDYKDEETAYNEAKEWLFYEIEKVRSELEIKGVRNDG